MALALAFVLGLTSACGGSSEGSDATDAPTSAPTVDGSASTTTPPTTRSAEGPPRPSPGCEADGATAETVKEEIDLTAGGEDRTYLLTAPGGEEPQPLILDFHGLAEGAQVHSLMSALGELGLEEGFTTVFPQGLGSPARWRVGGLDASTELPYVDALLADVGERRCVDLSRVYATGLSNGAMMTSLLACTRSEVIAAFAPVAGLSWFDGCEPERATPILTFHGTEDSILKFNGGVGDLSIVTGGEPDPEASEVPEADLDGEGYPETARQWAEALGCDPESTDTEVTPEIIERDWVCPDGVELQFVIVVGGGHTWPGSDFSANLERIMGPTTFDVSANEAMWEMFQRHQLPA